VTTLPSRIFLKIARWKKASKRRRRTITIAEVLREQINKNMFISIETKSFQDDDHVNEIIQHLSSKNKMHIQATVFQDVVYFSSDND
jgi:hypothetical protein